MIAPSAVAEAVVSGLQSFSGRAGVTLVTEASLPSTPPRLRQDVCMADYHSCGTPGIDGEDEQ